MKIIINLGWNKLRKENKEKRKIEMSSRKRHNYKNLKIWKLGIEIVDDIFGIISSFLIDEKFGLKPRISRCSVSIPSNIAEGSSRIDKAFSHFIDISIGTSFELETQLIIAFNRRHISETQLNKFEEKIEEFQKMTMSFQNKL